VLVHPALRHTKNGISDGERNGGECEKRDSLYDYAREGADRKRPCCRTMRGAEILRRHLIGQ
jgi:hypothetical protein